MRLILLGIAFLVTSLSVLPTSAAAASSRRPWCLRTGSHGPTGGLNECSYYTLEQCRAAMGGGGDQCLQNPDIAWDRIEGRGHRPERAPHRRGY